MHRLVAIAAATVAACVLAGPAGAAASASIAALQVALQAQGQYPSVVDGIDGPLTRSGLASLQTSKGMRPTGKLSVATRGALGVLGTPLLGQRQLMVGAVGWDVSSLEFRLVRYGLSPKAVDGRFGSQTAVALKGFQLAHGLPADGIAGPRTFRALARPSASVAARPSVSPPVAAAIHVVRNGESFFSISQRYHVSPLLLAKASGLALSAVILPGQRLTLPAGVTAAPPASSVSAGVVTADMVRASLDHWSAVYGVDPRLARATAWMESGFQQRVVSNVGAVGVMQLLPQTWTWVDRTLLRTTTPRTYDGNVQAGVRYLRWLLDQFGGDRQLALAGYYQGAQAVRDRGLFDDTKRYVAIILKLYGSV